MENIEKIAFLEQTIGKKQLKSTFGGALLKENKPLLDILKELGIISNFKQYKELINNKSLRLNGKTITDLHYDFSKDFINGIIFINHGKKAKRNINFIFRDYIPEIEIGSKVINTYSEDINDNKLYDIEMFYIIADGKHYNNPEEGELFYKSQIDIEKKNFINRETFN